MTQFQEAVVAAVRKVPHGKVVSYGQIAAYIGLPRAARQVGWAMASVGEVPDFPWWRVVNKDGVITITNKDIAPQLQRRLLEDEGVVVDDAFRIDMKRFRYDLLAESSAADDEGQQRLHLIDDKFFD